MKYCFKVPYGIRGSFWGNDRYSYENFSRKGSLINVIFVRLLSAKVAADCITFLVTTPASEIGNGGYWKKNKKIRCRFRTYKRN